MSLSTHILDTSRGRPAAGVHIRLEIQRDGEWKSLIDGRTNADGRVAGWQAEQAGVYRLIFATGEYLGPDAFYPEVIVQFQIAEPGEHYHVPLLLSPFGYSTYRGS
jgi:5-hydroxyisourate hydrolase